MSEADTQPEARRLNYEAMKMIDISAQEGETLLAPYVAWQARHSLLLRSHGLTEDGSEVIQSDGSVVANPARPARIPSPQFPFQEPEPVGPQPMPMDEGLTKEASDAATDPD